MFHQKMESWFPVVQHYALLIGGLLGVGYETVLDKIERPYLLIMFGGMMGLAEIAHAWRNTLDERKDKT